MDAGTVAAFFAAAAAVASAVAAFRLDSTTREHTEYTRRMADEMAEMRQLTTNAIQLTLMQAVEMRTQVQEMRAQRQLDAQALSPAHRPVLYPGLDFPPFHADADGLA